MAIFRKNNLLKKSMLFLTGDIHHMSLKTDDQKFLKESEAKLAVKYVKIAQNYGLKVTLFITGKTFREESRSIKRLLKYDNLEIGGHTWNGFRPLIFHYFLEIFFGSFCGPYVFQQFDIKKTLQIIKKTTGVPCLSWRGHELKCDKNTEKILIKNGVKILSSKLDPQGRIRKTKTGLIDVPINIIPDHSYILHAAVRGNNFLQESWKKKIKKFFRKKTKPTFGNKLYEAKEWLEKVKRDIVIKLKENGYALLLLHPACMEIIDGMETFESLCQFIKNKGIKTYFLKDVLNNEKKNF